jgi:hypothetical protein
MRLKISVHKEKALPSQTSYTVKYFFLIALLNAIGSTLSTSQTFGKGERNDSHVQKMFWAVVHRNAFFFFFCRCKGEENSFQSCPLGRKFQKQTNAPTVKDISQKAGSTGDFLKKRKLTAREQRTTTKSKEH